MCTRVALAIVAIAVLAVIGSQPAWADTVTVTNTNDSGPGSLRQAIMDTLPHSVIDATGVSGTIDLQSELPALPDDVELRGPGADQLTVRRAGGGQYRIFTTIGGGISGLTVANGSVTAGNSGGGIIATGTVALERVAVVGNSAGGRGGGIAILSGSTTIADSTISGNSAAGTDSGGGVDEASGSVTIRNSTIAENTGVGSAGAGGVRATDATIDSSTIAANTNASGSANLRGGVDLRNSIVAEPHGGGTNCTPGGGQVFSQGFNIASDNSCNLIVPVVVPPDPPGDQPSTDPQLAPLGDYGGPTETMALPITSPAVDKGSAGSLTADQRAESRPFDWPGIANAAFTGGDGSDIGAFERHPEPLVTNTDDSGVGSLRDAIADANEHPGADTVTFAPALSGTVQLQSFLPPLADDATIQGPGADRLTVRRQSGGDYPVFAVGGGVIAEIAGLTIANGKGGEGGGIHNTGVLTVRRAAVTASSGDLGGGIFNANTLTVIDSTVSGNSTAGIDAGGGIYSNSAFPVTIRNSTVSGNSAAGDFSAGGIWVTTHTLNPIVSIENSTIAANTNTNPAGAANLLRSSPADLQLRSTIVSGPLGGAANCVGSITSEGYNLSSDASCNLSAPTDQPSASPQLGSLANNGGPTRTMKPATTSPVIDKGDAGALISDQRGRTRPFGLVVIPNATGGDGADVGALELQASEFPPPKPTAPVQSLVRGAQLGASAVPVRFNWSVLDDFSPAASIQSTLQQRTNASGSWSAFSNLAGPTTAKALIPSLPANATLRQFRIRAKDANANVGTGPAGTAFRVTPYQEFSPAIAYSGTWTQKAQSGAFGGGVRSSTQPGAKAALTSTGRNLAVVAPLTATGGAAKVCLDPGTASQSCSTVDLSPASGLGARREVFVRNGLNASVTHKIQVTVLSGRVDLDAFVALR
jgi:hypothetical protein